MDCRVMRPWSLPDAYAGRESYRFMVESINRCLAVILQSCFERCTTILPRSARAILCGTAIFLPAVQPASNQNAPHPAKVPDAAIPVHFTDIRKSSGITFVQDSTGSDQKYYLETMGTGVAWLDYDQDGLMDLYLVQSGATDAYKPAKPLRSA